MMDAIFFDLDGTLTDPKPGITRSIQYALQKLDHPTIPSEDELTWCIGPPLRASFVRLLGGETSPIAPCRFIASDFPTSGSMRTRVYDGIGDVLTALGDVRPPAVRRHQQAACVRRTHHRPFRPAHHFERVFGSELDGTRVDKSRSAGIRAEGSAVDPSKTLMIGDRSHDMVGARNNGMKGIGVLYGYGSRDELLGAGAHHVCATPGAILGCIS